MWTPAVSIKRYSNDVFDYCEFKLKHLPARKEDLTFMINSMIGKPEYKADLKELVGRLGKLTNFLRMYSGQWFTFKRFNDNEIKVAFCREKGFLFFAWSENICNLPEIFPYDDSVPMQVEAESPTIAIYNKLIAA